MLCEIHRRLLHRTFFALACLYFSQCLAAAPVVHPDDVGRPLTQILDRVTQQNLPIVYSTSLVTPEMVVLALPAATAAIEALDELLAPYLLRIRSVGERYVVARIEDSSGADEELVVKNETSDSSKSLLEETVVRASYYEFVGGRSDQGLLLSRSNIEKMPVIANDPIRAIQLLPGVASGGISARPHLRGHALDDTGVYLNGNLLLEPFHAQNLQGLFSAIDSRAITDMEVYTGGFPAAYGNHMGGIVLLDSITPDTKPLREVGISVFNTSLLGAGKLGADNTAAEFLGASQIEWVISARRGNLDLVVDDRFGEPIYSDVFGHLKASFSGGSTLSLNLFTTRNDIRVIVEDDPAEPEQSDSNSGTTQLWLNWELPWSEHLSVRTTLSANNYKHRRIESLTDSEEIIASVTDDRETDLYRISQHWAWHPPGDFAFQFGADYEEITTDFDYRGASEYFGVYRLFDLPSYKIEREIDNRIDGHRMSAYSSGQWELNDTASAQFGLRWDKETYTGTDESGRISPFLGFTKSLGSDTDVQLNIGRYYQAQQSHQLQVQDGLETLPRAERTDAAVIAASQRVGPSVLLRGELYYQYGSRVRPRFENTLNPVTVLAEYRPDRVGIYPDSFTSTGAELTIEHNASEHFQWWASYALSDVKDEIKGAAVVRSWDQRHAVKMGFNWERGPLGFSMVATAHSGWPRTDLLLTQSQDGDPVLEFTERNSDRYSHFFTLDARLSYQRNFASGELTLFLEAANATNRENPCCLDFDVSMQDGGAPVLEIEEEFWLPILPNAGFLWQF